MIWVTLVLAMIAGYTVFWAGVISLVGMGGWKQLATRFPAQGWPEDEGVALSWQTASIGAANYGNVLKAVVTTDGFFLRPARMFSYNHPPVFIPWGSIVGTSSKFLGGIKLQLEDGKAISLRGKIVKYVQDALEAYDKATDRETIELLDDVGEEPASDQRTGGSQRVRA